MWSYVMQSLSHIYLLGRTTLLASLYVLLVGLNVQAVQTEK